MDPIENGNFPSIFWCSISFVPFFDGFSNFSSKSSSPSSRGTGLPHLQQLAIVTVQDLQEDSSPSPADFCSFFLEKITTQKGKLKTPRCSPFGRGSRWNFAGGTSHKWLCGCFLTWWDIPQNHPFVHRVFHDFHHPFWGPTPILGNPHIEYLLPSQTKTKWNLILKTHIQSSNLCIQNDPTFKTHMRSPWDWNIYLHENHRFKSCKNGSHVGKKLHVFFCVGGHYLQETDTSFSDPEFSDEQVAVAAVLQVLIIWVFP